MSLFNKHISDILTGGWPALRWKIMVFKYLYLSLILNAIWAIPAILLIRCLRPWRIIRFGRINSDCIGSFTGDVGQIFAMTRQQSDRFVDYYWFDNKYNKDPCNEFWVTMTRRNFRVHSWIRPLYGWNNIIPGGKLHTITIILASDQGRRGWREETNGILPFLPEEDARAKEWLRRQGWSDGEPFVCLLMRDNSYYNITHTNFNPTNKGGIKYDKKTGYGWSHYDYRNSDIATYVPAAEWLADQGVWVLRMGKIMAQPIPTNHPRIIDYAFHPDKSDFLDIWLFAHCDLCFSTGTGPDTLSAVYRRPLLIVNYLPLQWLFSWCQATHLFKTLTWKNSGIPLSLREQYDSVFEYPDQVGIQITNLTSQEILSAVQEQWKRLQGTWVDTDEDKWRKRRFWEILREHPDFDKAHGWIHPECRAGATWLRSKGDDYLK